MKLYLLILCATVVTAIIDESRIKIFKWRGPPVMDETIFTNPNSFDYDFNEDLIKSADTDDVYDQVVRQLPAFQVFRKGHEEGYTKVPIVTRKVNTWSTLADTRGPKDYFATSPMPVEPKFVTNSPTTRDSFISTTAAPISSTTTERSFVRNHVNNMDFKPPSYLAHQPAPAFKAPDPSNHGPIWRKGGQIVFNKNNKQPIATFTTTNRPFARLLSNEESPVHSTRSFSNFHLPQHRNNNMRSTTQVTTTTITSSQYKSSQHSRHLFNSHPKPVIIQRGNEPHRGPTYNCRVLNPFEDGMPSHDHDSTCKMLYPGLSLDGTCRCIYTVSGRDENGCAVGYLYSCKSILNRRL